MTNSQIKRNSQSAGKIPIIWLAGFWDGEGSFLLQSRKTNRGGNWFCPELSVFNNDEDTMYYIKSILSKLNIGSSLQKRIPKNDNHRIQYRLVVAGLTRSKRLLDLLSPYLITKKKRALLILKFIDKRLSVKGNIPYGKFEKKIIKQLSELKIGKSSTTIRETLANHVKHDSMIV